MSLAKRIIFGLFVALSFGAACWAYFHLKNSKKPSVGALTVVPDSCLVYLSSGNFFELNRKINSQNLLVDKLKQFDEIESFCNTLQNFDSLLSVNEDLQEQLKNNKLHFALYKNSDWLLAFNIKQLGEQNFVEETLSELFHAEKTENEVYSFYVSKSQKWFFKLNTGITLLSNSPQMLQSALDIKMPKLVQNANFIAFKNTLEENAVLSLYVNHALYAESKAVNKFNLSAVTKKSFSAGSVDFQPSQITVNGFLNPDTSEVISLLNKQQAQNADFTNVLPMSTISFTAYGFENFYNIHQKTNRHQKFWQAVNDSAMYNLEKDFYGNSGGLLVNFETKFSNRLLTLIKVEDTLLAAEHLRSIKDSAFQNNSETVFCFKKAEILFSPLSSVKANCAALHKQYLLFAEDADDLLYALRELKNKNVLDKNESFYIYKTQHFPETFNVLMYASPNLLKEQIHTVFNFETKAETNPFENFKHFSFSAINYSQGFKFRWNVSHEAEAQNKNTLWTLNLQNPCQIEPFGFVNHKTKENEIVVQDEAKVLYLINAKGTVLWKKQLDEKILSPVYMVDALKNNKYQLLFNTKSQLHLIDRNGNYLNNYPVKLAAEASSPLSLLDYDNDKEYRLLIACKNKTIYNYAVSGNKQEHFSPVKTEHEVSLPVQYVKVGESDYLVTIDNNGKIYTFSRKGLGRIGLKNQTVANCRAFYVDAANNINSTFLYYADDKNVSLHKISFSDKKEIIQLHSNISDADIIFENVNNDRNTDIVFTTNSHLMVYGLSGNLLFEKNRNAESPALTQFYSDMTHSLFMTWSETLQKLIVLDQMNSSEKTYKATAFPLVSNLFNDGKKYVIVVNGKELSCRTVD